MKANLVIDSISRAGGGIFDAERRLHQELAIAGVTTEVFALADEFSEEDADQWQPLKPRMFNHRGPCAIGYSPSLHDSLIQEPADLIYRAGLWRHPSRDSHRWSLKYRKPEIIAPHGMLDPWAIRNSRWKKKIAHTWFEGRHLQDAFCLRALCAAEAASFRSYGLENPICVIPNGIDLPEKVGDHSKSEGKKKLLFLGRIHPKKGLLNAVRAWKKASRTQGYQDWQFVIAGWDQGGHEFELKQLCDELGISCGEVALEEFNNRKEQSMDNYSIVFVGPAFGLEKDVLLRDADAFILPSYSEGLPMSILEAWSYRLPVIMTDHCNLPEGFEADAALRITSDEAGIVEGMNILLGASLTDLLTLGGNGRSLVESRFTWNQVAGLMNEVYGWVAGGESAPQSVLAS